MPYVDLWIQFINVQTLATVTTIREATLRWSVTYVVVTVQLWECELLNWLQPIHFYKWNILVIMLRQSRSRPMTPSRYNNNNNYISDNIKKEERSAERRSSQSLTRSPMVLKPSHWSKELKEVTLITAKDGVFNFRVVGGSDHGEFPVVSEVMPPDTRGVEYTSSNTDASITTQVSQATSYSWLYRDQIYYMHLGFTFSCHFSILAELSMVFFWAK